MNEEMLQEFKKNLAIVEGRALPGLRDRSLAETVTTGIIPITPITPGAISGANTDVELQLPECLEPFTDPQILLLIQAAEKKGVTAEQFFQVAEELGADGVTELLGEAVLQEIIGTALAGIAAYKAGKALYRHFTSPDRLRKKAMAQGYKAKINQAKASTQQAKADTYTAKTNKVKAKAGFKAAKMANSQPSPGASTASAPAASPAKQSGSGAVATIGKAVASHVAAKVAQRGARRQALRPAYGKTAARSPSTVRGAAVAAARKTVMNMPKTKAALAKFGMKKAAGGKP